MWTIAQHTDTTTGQVSWQVRLTDDPSAIVASALPDRAAALQHVGGLLAGALVAAAPDAPVGPRFEASYEEGQEARDGGYYIRVIDPGATNFDRATPIPLMATDETSWGHDGAVMVGAITTAAREGATTIRLEGRFDTSRRALEFARQVDAGMLTRHSPDLIGPIEDEFECTEYDEEWGWCEEGIAHFTRATLGGTTIVPFPALDDATITLPDGLTVEPANDADDEAVAAGASTAGASNTEQLDALLGQDLPRRLVGGFVASATATAPVRSVTTLATGRPTGPFDPAMFSDPGLDGPTPIEVLPDFSVRGHVATWFDADGSPNCHIGIQDRCVTPPHSESGYAYAHQGGPIELTNGERIRVGHLTVGIGHAPTSGITAEDATAHYDHTDHSAAMVRFGEDDHGIWCAGVVNPQADDFQIWALELATLSGDWRRIGGNLELVAALGVNVPGFPIADVVTASAAGECTALIAAGSRGLARLKATRPAPVPGPGLRPLFDAAVANEQVFEDIRRMRSDLTRRIGRLERHLTEAIAEEYATMLGASIGRPSEAPTRRSVRLDRELLFPPRG
jgi:hypothetical protein